MKHLKKILYVFLAFVTAAAPNLCLRLNMPRTPQGQTLDRSKFTLTWRDEFDGDTLDKSKWGNSWWETMRKGGYWHEDMVSVEDGDLVIRAEYLDTPLENRYYEKWHDNINFDPYLPGYYTGEINTRGKFEQCYGYFEVRCILPAGTGLWSSFWMMNEGVFNVDGFGDDGTEVDVFESMYYKDHWRGMDAVIGGIHYDGYAADSKGDSIGKFFLQNDPYTQYNTYGLEWNKDEYIFYINDVECDRISTGGVSDNPEHLILSVEIAGKDGVADADRHGTGKITHTPKRNWPVEFRVDYVRVYQYKDLAPTEAA
ncbi:MAG: glycoside hydrolase family 16 protein [Clostridia bacterium]|nr:glycoside hydrolase family 16 protein [Clostridia bacterium]